MTPGQRPLPADLKEMAGNSPFSRHVGPFLERDIAEGAHRAFVARPEHANVQGMVHGGMLMTFADMVLSAAIRKANLTPAVTVKVVTDFVGPARIGDLVEGTSRIERATENLVFLSGRIFVGEHRVAALSGIFSRVRAGHEKPPAKPAAE
ncbi:MAG: PaaI family thioesterase [Alphaproteobacteria bacterium]|nr:PaaI family thioesterase [Alphaproteobacteria bacterium]